MTEMKKKIYESIEDLVDKTPMPEETRQEILRGLMRMRKNKLNLLITGATGCGKSSTINAMFDMEVAKVGVSVDPETMDIEKYELENMVIWDTPGLGDGAEADRRHSSNIKNKLRELDSEGKPLIDLVLVILDGSTRDLGTSYELINKVIIPNLGDEASKRLLVAVNQADVAMKGGRHWDYEANKPDAVLEKFLEEKCASIKRRIKEATGVDVDPIYYSAGFKEEGVQQARPYNITKLFYYLLKNAPAEKRLALVENINTDEEMWKDDDRKHDYKRGIGETVRDTVTGAIAGAKIGGMLGSVAGPAGRAVGTVVGAIVGGVCGLFGW